MVPILIEKIVDALQCTVWYWIFHRFKKKSERLLRVPEGAFKKVSGGFQRDFEVLQGASGVSTGIREFQEGLSLNYVNS